MLYFCLHILVYMLLLSDTALCVRDHPRLEGPNYAGREFIFTFGDNRPNPDPVIFLLPYSFGTTNRVIKCNITFYLGPKTSSNKVVEIGTHGALVEGPPEMIILASDGEPLLAKKSVHVIADDEIVIYGFSKALFSTDAFLVLPVDVLGLQYIVPSSEHTMTGLNASSLIVVTGACSTTTSVTFQFKTSVRYLYPNKDSIRDGHELTVSLNKFETMSLLSNSDLSGTLVSSDCPVAVSSGNKRGKIDGQTGDHMIEMIPPISRLGKTYITMPIKGTLNGDKFKLIGATPNSKCAISLYGANGKLSSEEITLERGQVHSIDTLQDNYAVVECSQASLLSQYSKSGKIQKYGDPFMALVPALVQYDSLYVVATVPEIKKHEFDHFISLMVPTGYISTLKVNNAHLFEEDSFDDLNGTIYNVTRFDLPVNYSHVTLNVTDGVYRLEQDNPTITFGITIYGLKKSQSYGYVAGFRLTYTDDHCEKGEDISVNDNIDNDCDGLVDEELQDGKDNDGDGFVDEDVAANDQYPAIDIQSPKNYREEETSKGQGEYSSLPWFIALVIILIILGLLIVLAAVWNGMRGQNLASPAEFQSRISPDRISIRSVWKGFKTATAPHD